MKRSTKPKEAKKSLKVRDIALKPNQTKNVRGGGVAPCWRPKN